MEGAGKKVGVVFAAGLAMPIAALSGVATAIFLLLIVQGAFGMGPASWASSGFRRVTVWQLMTGEWMLYLLISGSIFVLAFRSLRKLSARAKALIEKINANEKLMLDGGNLLGHPAPVGHLATNFLAFDARNRRIAACDIVSGQYTIHDFSWVRQWEITWREEEIYMGRGAVHAKDFVLTLQVADPQQPLRKFPMSSRRAAEAWNARLNAILNN
jgi:hypothetical protein